MLVFFVILAFAAESLYCVDASRPRPGPICPVPPCPVNETYVKCRQVCPPQNCNISYTSFAPCAPDPPCESGCDCIENYLRNDKGECVLNDDCPAPQPQCGENQMPSDCADNYSPVPQITVCRPGCRCIEGYTRNSYDECVPTPPLIACGDNEEAAACRQSCPPQTCDWDPTRYACKPGPCQSGCNCVKGYKRNKEGICIPEEKCPPNLPQCPENEEPTDCARSIANGTLDPTLVRCRPCQCIENYVRNSEGVCVSKDELCNGDKNTTYTQCPNRCLSTCKNPNGVCSQECREGYGCQCNPGYLLNDDGKCILPQDCPGGNPCGVNQTFVYCNAGCPTANCPESDSRAIIACSQPYPCPSGCACKYNYKYDSAKREKCILASECPAFECTRPNEIFEPCPSACFTDSCVASSKIRCVPGCKCIEGYERNSNRICVPKVCGKIEEPNFCIQVYPNNCPRCRCVAGYQRNANGVCEPIPQPQCPKNEEPNECPSVYPSPDIQIAVESPPTVSDSQGVNEDLTVVGPVRCRPCKCIQGYVRNANGSCVPTPQCGKYEEQSPCGDNNFPQVVATSDVDSARIRCVPGCRCIEGYERNSDGICEQKVCGKNEEPNFCIQIYPNNCPRCRCVAGYQRNANGVCEPIPQPQCPKNEEPNECPSVYPSPDIQIAVESPLTVSDSQGANEDLTVVGPVRCRPCKCIQGYVRNANGSCVPISQPQCPKYEEPNECASIYPTPDIQTTYVESPPIVPTSQDLTVVGPVRCRPCRCIQGYVRDTSGSCVPIERGCNGDLNATYTECPNQCLSTCKNPNAICSEKCEPYGCGCKPGYILSDEGLCIYPQDCPGGDPCGKNKTYVTCNAGCPSKYCPKDDSRFMVACLPPFPCAGGCACKRNYLLNYEDDRCILASECPPVECTRKNEVHRSCPPPCFSEECGNEEVVPATCNTLLPHVCQPRCVCCDGYRRDTNGDCIPKNQCPAVEFGSKYAVGAPVVFGVSVD